MNERGDEDLKGCLKGGMSANWIKGARHED